VRAKHRWHGCCWTPSHGHTALEPEEPWAKLGSAGASRAYVIGLLSSAPAVAVVAPGVHEPSNLHNRSTRRTDGLVTVRVALDLCAGQQIRSSLAASQRRGRAESESESPGLPPCANPVHGAHAGRAQFSRSKSARRHGEAVVEPTDWRCEGYHGATTTSCSLAVGCRAHNQPTRSELQTKRSPGGYCVLQAIAPVFPHAHASFTTDSAPPCHGQMQARVRSSSPRQTGFDDQDGYGYWFLDFPAWHWLPTYASPCSSPGSTADVYPTVPCREDPLQTLRMYTKRPSPLTLVLHYEAQ
jgi:hypothetical protein